MFFQSHVRWLPATIVVGAAFALVAASESPAGAQARQVPAESLVYDLKNPDPARRQVAARELGVAKHAPATPALVALAHDPDVSVRREVELSLEQIEDIRVLPGLVQFTADTEKDIRDRAVQAVVNLYLPRATGPGATLARFGNLINPLSDQYSDTVIEPDITVDAAVVVALRARMSDPEIKIRRNATRGLGILRAEAAIPELVVAVREDFDDQVRFEAIRALRKIGEALVGESLMPLLNLNNDRVRNEIITTLGHLRYRGAVSELTRIFERAKPTERIRLLALSALADIADPSSRSLFQKFKGDKSDNVRLYAQEGLARMSDTALLTTVSGDRLTEKSGRVRTAQAFALLRMGRAEYLDELIRGIGQPATRALAKEYLIETRPTERPLLFAKRAKSPTVRAELADVFGLIGDPLALPALQELARDPHSGVAQTAERALRRINAKRSDVVARDRASSLPAAP